jgi:hypothetical protein
VRAKAVRAEASRWARAKHQGGGGTCSVAEGMREAHLLVAEHILAEHYDRRISGSKVRAAVDAFLVRLRLDPSGLVVKDAQREITFRDAEKGPIELQMTPSPTDYLDMLDPETIPYNAQKSPLSNGYGTRHQDFQTSISYNGVVLSLSNYFKFSVLRRGFGTQFHFQVDAVREGETPWAFVAETPMNYRGVTDIDGETLPHIRIEGAGTMLDFRDTYDDSRRPYDLGWRYEGDDAAWDLVTRAFFDGASFQSLGGDAAAKVEILRFLLRLLGAPAYYNDCISSYPIVESNTIWETWKYALPGAPHPDSHERELRGGQAWVTVDDAYRKREAELKAAVEAQYVL